MMRILCSAQSFGYGPCSKLLTFVKHLKQIYQGDIKIDFIGDDVALTYVLQNSLYFNNIFEYQGEYPNAKNYDMVISVMNPYTAIWGWFNRKKVLYIDSLYWFWKWDKNNFGNIQKIIQRLTSVNNLEEVWSILKEVDDHSLQYIAHVFSSISCIQEFSSTKKETSADPFRKYHSNFSKVGPIINTSLKTTSKGLRNKILISLGGLYSPLNRFKEGVRYTKFVLNLIDEFVGSLPKDIEVILTTNPNIISNINSKVDRLTITSLNNEQFLKTLNEAVVVITPPSITTIYESLFYDVPVIFLPEQHDGHFPNFLKLSSKKITLNRLRKIFPELLFGTRVKTIKKRSVDNEILYIQSLIKKFSPVSSNPIILEMEETLMKCLDFITDGEKRDELLHNQQKIIFNNLDVVDAQQVQNLINKLSIIETLPKVVKRNRVGIISSAVEPDDKSLIRKAKHIGKMLASHNINIATGASIGYAHIIGSAAKIKGVELIGYSPAKNSFLHQQKSDNALIKNFDEIYFNENGFTARSINFLTSVDAVIMLAGRIGTLSEFTIAFEEMMPIFILKGFGGISDHIENILDIAKKESKSRVFIFSNEKKLIEKLSSFLKGKYYK